jgi:competence protein ComEA
MTQDGRSLSRAGLLARRLLSLVAVAVLVGSVASTSLDRSVALAERPPAARPGRPPAVAPPPAPRPALAGKLNLNTATASELEALPGIGPAKAGRILEFRGKHGRFKRIADLRRVKGFGKKTVDRLAPLLTVEERTTLGQK